MSEAIARSALEEYLGAENSKSAEFIQIQSKSLRPFQQQIYVVHGLDTDFALKLNLTENGQQSLETEFENLKKFKPHFADQPRLGLPTPYHFSPEKRAMITQYCSIRTLRENIQNARSPETIHRIMETAGHWLAHFHPVSVQTEKRVWPGWMVQKAQRMTDNRKQSAADAKLAAQAIQKMTARVPNLRGRFSTFGTAHKDLNSANLLADKSTAIGLDLTMIDQGLQILDLAYLMCDVDIFHGLGETTPRARLLPAIRSGFLKGYGARVDPELLDFTMDMTLLFIWLRITPERLLASHNLRRRNDYLRERLRLRVELL